MFNLPELNLLNKLLHKIKYSDFNEYDMTEFSNSPIMNSILVKIRSEFSPKVTSKIIEDSFVFESATGKAIQKKLTFMSNSSYETILKFEKQNMEKFILDIIGPIHSEKEEKEKLEKFIISLAQEKIGR